MKHPLAGDAVGESHLHAADGKDSANARENGWAEDDFATLDTADNQAAGRTPHKEYSENGNALILSYGLDLQYDVSLILQTLQVGQQS